MKSQFRGSANKELIECMPNSTTEPNRTQSKFDWVRLLTFFVRVRLCSIIEFNRTLSFRHVHRTFDKSDTIPLNLNISPCIFILLEGIIRFNRDHLVGEFTRNSSQLNMKGHEWNRNLTGIFWPELLDSVIGMA